MRPSTRLLWGITGALLVCSSAAFGSGFAIFEQGAKATAMGGAFAATADDPTAIFYNVAGIAQQRQAEMIGGGTIINFANQFNGAPNDPITSGTTASYRAHTFFPPNGYAIVPIGKNLTFGVGIFTPFGLRTNWQEPYVGRYISRDANVKTLSVEPAIAWQTSDGRFAIGGGPEYRRSHILLNRNNLAFDPFNQRIVDVANAYLASKWDNAWGWNVGVLAKPNANWRIGASYRAEMTINYHGDAKFTQIPTGNAIFDGLVAQQLPANQPITTSINYPATAVLGLAHTNGSWDVEFDLTRTTWSRFKTLNINFPETPALNLIRPQNWKNTWQYRLGANHKASTNWDVRLGAVYDQNPQPTEGVGPLLPDSDRAGVAFGVGYHHGPFVIDATEFALHFLKRSSKGINLDGFNGTYKTDANLISIDLGYKF